MHIDSRYPISHCFLLGGKRRACRAVHIQAHVAVAAPPGGSNAHLFAQLRMLRVRQGHSLNRSTDEFDLTAPECSHCPLALLDFHELSRAVGPKETGSKIATAGE